MPHSDAAKDSSINALIFCVDPEGQQQVRDFEHCLQLMNALLTVPPKWSKKAEDVGLIGCPFNAVLGKSSCLCFKRTLLSFLLQKLVQRSPIARPPSVKLVGRGNFVFTVVYTY